MKKTRRIVLAALGLAVLSGSLYADVPFASRENVDKKKASLSRHCCYGKMIDYGIGAVATGLCIYFGYKLYKSITKDKPAAQIRTLDNRKLSKKVIRLKSKFKALKEPKMLSKKWTFNLFKSAAKSILSSSLAGIGIKQFDTVYKHYHCFDTITEFITVRFGGFGFIDELLSNAQLFAQYATPSKSELQKSKERFIVSLNNVVAIMEYVVAYMEHRVESFDQDALSQEDKALAQHLFDCLNEYCSKVELFFSNDLDEKLFLMTSALRDDIVRFVEGFKGLENRMMWAL